MEWLIDSAQMEGCTINMFTESTSQGQVASAKASPESRW